MTKQQKQRFEEINNAMTIKTRDDKTEFYCFSDKASETLKNLFLEHYEVRDLDYQIFSKACDYISERELSEILSDDFELIDGEFASYYYDERLSYLNIWNDEEISDYFKNYSCDSISMACAYWFDNQVNDAIYIIRDYIINK